MAAGIARIMRDPADRPDQPPESPRISHHRRRVGYPLRPADCAQSPSRPAPTPPPHRAQSHGAHTPKTTGQRAQNATHKRRFTERSVKLSTHHRHPRRYGGQARRCGGAGAGTQMRGVMCVSTLVCEQDARKRVLNGPRIVRSGLDDRFIVCDARSDSRGVFVQISVLRFLGADAV